MTTPDHRLSRGDSAHQPLGDETSTVREVIPIRDENPTRRRAVVTLVLIGLNVAVWLLLQPHGSDEAVVRWKGQRTVLERELANAPELRFTLSRAAIPCEVVERRALTVDEVFDTFDRGVENACNVRGIVGDGIGRKAAFPDKNVAVSVLVSMFLHGGFLHLAGNMLFLWIFGNNIEDRWGRARYLLFYLIAGVVATLSHVAAGPRSTVPMVGASGAIAGVMGAYLVFYPNVRINTLITLFVIFFKRIRAAWLLAFWFVSQFFLTSGSGVAWVAHVGGFVFGAVLAFVINGFHVGERTGPG